LQQHQQQQGLEPLHQQQQTPLEQRSLAAPPSPPPSPLSSQLHISSRLLLLQASLHWPTLQPQELSLLLWSLSQLYPQPQPPAGSSMPMTAPAQLNPQLAGISLGLSGVPGLMRPWVGPALSQLLRSRSYSSLKPQELIMLMSSLAWLGECDRGSEGGCVLVGGAAMGGDCERIDLTSF
jgi:hypothetical protein